MVKSYLVQMVFFYGLCFSIAILITYQMEWSFYYAFFLGYALTYLDPASKFDGYICPSLQYAEFWKYFAHYHDGEINVEEDLDSNGQYIFASFPHGACSVSHGLTMTNSAGMFSRVFAGDRRDLAASVLFLIPLFREFCLLLGCVDASSQSANYQLAKKRSLLIYIGGEKEQMMTKPKENKIYLRARKGFIKLALVHGASLVPCYTYGENEMYHVSDFLIETRRWIQEKFAIAIPLVWGRFFLLPLKTPLKIEMGKPLAVEAHGKAVTQADIDALHARFMAEMERLFERTKAKHGFGAEDHLLIL